MEKTDEHGREHAHVPRTTKYLGIALGVTLTFFFVEMIGGILTNSLALQSDAWHMLNDFVALGFAYAAAKISMRPPTKKKTFGFYRSEVLAAFVNGIFLIVIVVFIFYQAFVRLQQPPEVGTVGMLTIGVFGLAANGVSAFVLSRSEEKSINVRGAMLHVMADALGSVGVISGGLIMHYTGFFAADSIIAVLIGLLILFGTWRLLRESIHILLAGVPHGINLDEVEKTIKNMRGVTDIHDLHVWCISPTQICAMSAHVVVEPTVNRKRMLNTLIFLLKERFGIDHTTIQIEEAGIERAAREH